MPDPLESLVKLAEPISKLIDSVCSAVGVIYEPTQIKALAKANVSAEIIRIQGEFDAFKLKASFLDEIANNPMLKNAIKQFSFQEYLNQQNITSIINKAIPFLPNTVSSEPVDIDWLRYFFEHCKIINNDEAQTLWAKLLADEVASPGSFSKRTILTLSTLSKNDAILFNRCCSFICTNDSNQYFAIIDPFDSSYLSKFGLSFDDVLKLRTLGLLLSTDVRISIPDNSNLSYFSDNYNLVFGPWKGARLVENYNEDKDGKIISTKIDAFVLTDIGSELYHVTKPTPHESYKNFVLGILRNRNFLITVQ